MNRRGFLTGAAVVGATTGLSRGAPAWAAEAGVDAQRRPPAQSTLVVNGLDPSNLTEEYLGMLEAGGVTCWHKSVGGARQSFSDVYNFIDEHGDRIQVVRSVGEIREVHRQGKLGLLFGWQSANVLSGGRSDENDWWSDPPRTNLRSYYELGLRICGIAYQIANAFGAGAIDGHIGLSRAGRQLIEEIHKLRIVLDVGGHTGDRTSLDAIQMSSGVPIICSHGNVRGIANSTRNLGDEVIEAIAGTGGVIGVVAINDYVVRGKEMAHLAESPWVTVDEMLEHAEYIRDLVGVDHVGLGPDFTWGRSPIRDRVLFGADAMDEGPRRFVKGFENISELPNVIRALERRGWPEWHIQKFLGGNWLRVYEQVWGA